MTRRLPKNFGQENNRFSALFRNQHNKTEAHDNRRSCQGLKICFLKEGDQSTRGLARDDMNDHLRRLSQTLCLNNMVALMLPGATIVDWTDEDSDSPPICCK